MNLKAKVIVILLCLICLYGIMDYGIQRFIVFPRFEELEKAQAADNLERSIHAFQREVRHLDSLCHDWASWDDMYRFIQDPSEEFIRSNLGVGTFKDNGINLIYV